MKIRIDDITWRRVEDDIIILDLRTSTYLRLNHTGAALWERLASSGATREELANTLIERAGADPDVATQHAAAFLDVLREKDLIA